MEPIIDLYGDIAQECGIERLTAKAMAFDLMYGTIDYTPEEIVEICKGICQIRKIGKWSEAKWVKVFNSNTVKE